MSKTNAYETELLTLEFNATNMANIADNAASAPITNWYISLHTASPGEAGDQTTNEIAYTGYARVAVARTSGGWTVSGNAVTPVANIDFQECTGGSGTATHFGIGTAASGAGRLRRFGTLTPNIAITTGVIARIKSTSSVTED